MHLAAQLRLVPGGEVDDREMDALVQPPKAAPGPRLQEPGSIQSRITGLGGLTSAGHYKGNDLIMRRDSPGDSNQAPYKAKTTFFNITADKFHWRYEGALMNDPENFQEQFRLFSEKQ
jgi:hypothetical protein